MRPAGGKLTRAARFAALFLFAAGWSLFARASVSISPVRVDFDASQRMEIIRFGNGGAETRSYQVDVVSWSQSGVRGDVHDPTDDVLAVPPVFTLEPGQQQVIRVGLLREPDPATELAYRVFITELAPPQEEKPEGAGVAMRLRVGVPVFVAPSAGPSAQLDLVGSERDGETLLMQFRNAGNVHVKISEIQYEAPGLADARIEPAMLYVLPGQSGSLPVALPYGNAVGTVTLVTDTAGNLEYDLRANP